MVNEGFIVFNPESDGSLVMISFCRFLIMNTRLESLPNELLVDVFQYLDAQDLFRAFYQLNTRLNTLLHSLNNLSLTLMRPDTHQTIPSPIDVQTVIVAHGADVNLDNFVNLRRLKFLQPTCEQLDRFDSVELPHLEYLFMGYGLYCHHDGNADHKHKRCDKVFSDAFPNLKSCYLFHPEGLYTFTAAIQMTELRILRVRKIDLPSYQVILSVCPNLHFFRLEVPNVKEQTSMINSHGNLRRMVLEFDSFATSLGDDHIDDYLSSIPNLEQLSIYRLDEMSGLSPYYAFNWHATSINRYLPLLRRFTYYLDIYFEDESAQNYSDKISDRLRESFQRVHSNRYQSKLLFTLFPWSMFD